jgi:two-component system, cell cycle sensor histidine kinase and response regulator CckA
LDTQKLHGHLTDATVLVAEDESIVRLVLEEMLRKLGFRVLSATNGVEALDALDSSTDDVDLVIFDMTMPAMDGRQLFDRLQSAYPQAKTVLASGAGMDIEVSTMRAEGLNGYLPKPFSISQIREEISRVMGAAGEA